jgi:hypothetical protein
MRKLLVFVVALLVGLVFFNLWWNRLPPFDGHGEPVDTPFEMLSEDDGSVRVAGLAHYVVRAERNFPGGFLRSEKNFWLWPLFAPNDADGRRIEVMVASTKPPPRSVDLEDLVVEGWVRPPRSRVDENLESVLRRVGYHFDPDYLLLEMFPPED